MFKLSIDKKLLDFLWCCILKEGVDLYGQGSNKIHVINRKKLALEGIFRFSALFSHNQSYQQLCGRNGESLMQIWILHRGGPGKCVTLCQIFHFPNSPNFSTHQQLLTALCTRENHEFESSKVADCFS